MIKHQHPYMIVLLDGTKCPAMLIHLNEQYHRKAGSFDVWKRLDDVPRKERYVPTNKVRGVYESEVRA